MADDENTIIDKQYLQGQELIKYLNDQKEITLALEAETYFKKNLLIASASFFEKIIVDMIARFADVRSNGDQMIMGIIQVKAIERQYHTYFDWDKSNANKFFSLFGQTFKKEMEAIVKVDLNLESSIRAFLQLGQERNKLAHQNFAELVIDKTAHEVYQLYKNSIYFLNFIEGKLIA